MNDTLHQGDVLRVEGLRHNVLVVSKDFFNMTEMAFVCPIFPQASADALHIAVHTKETEGYVLCEQLKLLDLRARGHKRVDHIGYDLRIDISDAIQGIFDYL